MSSHKTLLLAVAAGCTVFASIPSARAQEIPAEPEPAGKNDWTDIPPAESAPPTTHSSTTTTSALYDNQAGAEREEETYRPNRPMLITGAALFLAPYVTGVVVAAQSNLDADKRNYIPLAGPWLDLGQRPCRFGSDCNTGDRVGSAFLISSGVAQGVGVLLALVSLGVPEHHTTVKRAAPATTTAVHVTPTPLSFERGGGIGAIGTF